MGVCSVFVVALTVNVKIAECGNICKTFQNCQKKSCGLMLINNVMTRSMMKQHGVEITKKLGRFQVAVLAGQEERITDEKCAEFISFVGSVEQKKLEEGLKNAPFFSILCDDMTDCAVLEQGIGYIRYCVEGNVREDFVAFKHVERSNATQIYECTVNVLEEYCGFGAAEIKDHLEGFASDGATVIRGVHSGVQTKFKQLNPCMIDVHCLAHHLELAVKDAVGKFPCVQSLNAS
ncbi:hypothetical protein PR048_001483 [Dryococelus australis]|uniref:DUF4371 domain-containing protein n=1 Tax=Dryococelus australis TaxID=614101 RepID=A0ABQ9IIZ3_9NEOP|nr:hypothetical protein PR048_001483 [Dryococelus australis]